jgi:hypothetical protein
MSESGTTDLVECLVKLEAEVAAMISFWISVVPLKMGKTLTLRWAAS